LDGVFSRIRIFEASAMECGVWVVVCIEMRGFRAFCGFTRFTRSKFCWLWGRSIFGCASTCRFARARPGLGFWHVDDLARLLCRVCLQYTSWLLNFCKVFASTNLLEIFESILA
jgi:hypothetical protein